MWCAVVFPAAGDYEARMLVEGLEGAVSAVLLLLLLLAGLRTSRVGTATIAVRNSKYYHKRCRRQSQPMA